ncbi:alpha/beta fold hydrolase [Marinactinospora thermotolerans]|uniref:alpha/beta fold hydrolase n=1 Tax=Marinactinospora thermotolerans TaxID=531310 RepID=UPI003D89E3C6
MKPWNIVYDRRGSGSPLVLLHGLGHRRQAWYPVMDELARRHDVIALDLPGFGRSPAPAAQERYDVDSLVDVVARACRALGLERPHLAGNSLGGAIALELGARGLAGSVTALAPIGFTTPREKAGTRLLTRGMGLAARIPEPVRLAAAASRPARAIAKRVLRGDPADPAVRELRFDATVLSPGSPFVRLARPVVDYEFTASEVPCPVTIGWGDLDRILPARAARRACARIPHARQVTLLGCGHVPMADRPRAVAAAILDTCRAGAAVSGE